jgi:hypothetical protein
MNSTLRAQVRCGGGLRSDHMATTLPRIDGDRSAPTGNMSDDDRTRHDRTGVKFMLALYGPFDARRSMDKPLNRHIDGFRIVPAKPHAA